MRRVWTGVGVTGVPRPCSLWHDVYNGCVESGPARAARNQTGDCGWWLASDWRIGYAIACGPMTRLVLRNGTDWAT